MLVLPFLLHLSSICFQLHGKSSQHAKIYTFCIFSAVCSFFSLQCSANRQLGCVEWFGWQGFSVGWCPAYWFQYWWYDSCQPYLKWSSLCLFWHQQSFFGGSTTDIRSVSGKVNPSLLLRLTNKGNLLHVDGWDKFKSIQADIYKVNGTEVKSFKQWNGEDIDISSLPHGVYIIKLGSQAAKFNK